MTANDPALSSGPCRKCDALPTLDDEACHFYIAAPENATQASIRQAAQDTGLKAESRGEAVLYVHLPHEQRVRFAENCRKLMRPLQLQDTRALLSTKPDGWTPAEVLQVRSLLEYTALLQHRFLIEILQTNRLITYFHPIVYSNDENTCFAYECLLRAIDVDGGIIPPSRLFGVAKDAQMQFQLDRAARVTALAAVAEHKVSTNIFINFVPSTIYRPEFCLRTTFAAVEEYGLDASQIVFEVVESESVSDTEHLNAILKHYRASGFRVALDDLGAGYSSLNLLHELRPDIVKLDMELVRGIDKDPYKATVCRTLLKLANELGIESIAEGIETREEWDLVRDAGATYGQGFLFAKPAAIPPIPFA